MFITKLDDAEKVVEILKLDINIFFCVPAEGRGKLFPIG